MTGWNFTKPNGPTRHFVTGSRETPSNESREGALQHRVRKVHQENVRARAKDFSAADVLEKRLWAEGNASHRATAAASGDPPERFVNDLTPAG